MMTQKQAPVPFDRRTALSTSLALAAGSMIGVHQSSAALSANAQWWRWRGNEGNNHAATGSSISPVIDPANARWAVNIPGRGHSTPIIVGDSLYMTTADKAKGTQSVVAVSRDGKPKWSQVIHEGGIPAENHPKNTEASPSMAFDGEALFASFYNSDGIQLTKLTTAGKPVWQKTVGRYSPNKYKYGYAASPLLYGDSVIVPGDYDGGGAFLAALDRASGQVKWKIKRPGKLSFSSPIVARVAGREQLLLSGAEMVASYDPASGNLLWKVDGATTMATCGTMVWDDARVFASGGYPEAETVCIAADGSGKVLWSNNVKCYEQSMLYHNGFIYAVADNSVAYCWKATDGSAMWRQRLGGKYSSSPILVGDTIHVFNEGGSGFAFAASADRYQSLGTSKVGDEVFASPVVVDNTMYLRVANKRGARQETLLAVS